MSESGGMNSVVPATSLGEPTELQSIADRVTSGLDLVRWALIASVVHASLLFVGSTLISWFWPMSYGSGPWVHLVLGTVGWLVAPLALLGVLRILRVRSWSVPRWLVISLVVYFAADSIWTPATSVHRASYWFHPDHSIMPALDVVSMVISSLLSLLCFAVLFAGFRLAAEVDAHFDRSLISRRHRGWLLWIGLALQGLMLAWWAVMMIWDPPTLLRDMGHDETTEMIAIAISLLLVSLPSTAWLIWLFVSALRIGRKLKRFATCNRCPRCDYYLHDRADAGCPECGWMRGSESAGAADAV